MTRHAPYVANGYGLCLELDSTSKSAKTALPRRSTSKAKFRAKFRPACLASKVQAGSSADSWIAAGSSADSWISAQSSASKGAADSIPGCQAVSL